jgi:transposase
VAIDDRLGHITKQGSSMMRFLLVEAAQVTVRSVPEWRSKYLHLMIAAVFDATS